MAKNNILSPEEFNALPVKERMIMTAGGKLISHFRALERANIINSDSAKKLIGCVQKLQSIARGEE